MGWVAIISRLLLPLSRYYLLFRTWVELPSTPGCSYHYPDIIYYLGHGLSSHLPPGCSYHYPDIIYYLGHGFSSHLPPGCSYHYLDGSTLVERISRILGWNKFNLIGKIIVKSLYTTFNIYADPDPGTALEKNRIRIQVISLRFT